MTDEELTDDEMRELMDAQNRDEDPSGDPDAQDPGAYESESDEDPPAIVFPDSVDDFSDLDEDEDEDDEDYDDD